MQPFVMLARPPWLPRPGQQILRLRGACQYARNVVRLCLLPDPLPIVGFYPDSRCGYNAHVRQGIVLTASITKRCARHETRIVSDLCVPDPDPG